MSAPDLYIITEDQRRIPVHSAVMRRHSLAISAAIDFAQRQGATEFEFNLADWSAAAVDGVIDIIYGRISNVRGISFAVWNEMIHLAHYLGPLSQSRRAASFLRVICLIIPEDIDVVELFRTARLFSLKSIVTRAIGHPCGMIPKGHHGMIPKGHAELSDLRTAMREFSTADAEWLIATVENHSDQACEAMVIGAIITRTTAEEQLIFPKYLKRAMSVKNKTTILAAAVTEEARRMLRIVIYSPEYNKKIIGTPV